MSLEAWGDDGGAGDYDHLIEAGWIGPDDAKELRDEIDRLKGLINSPMIEDFLKAVPLEAAHQVERWGSGHDERKSPWDWYWTLGYLGAKAAQAAGAGNIEKAKHHTVTAAALMLNWHRRLSGWTPVIPPKGPDQ